MNGFAQIHGQDRVVGFLRRALRDERLAHALLFAGPAGVGKGLTARALASWAQCEVDGEDACGRCASCVQIGAGSHADVRIVTPESGKRDIGVDRAREVKRFVQLAPTAGRLKFAIVDDAHALTVAAQNALLKTLEDPPANSILILVSDHSDALLATVRSRCQRLAFQPLPTDTVAEILVSRHGVDEGEARTLAAASEGSMSRALELRSTEPGSTSLLASLEALAGAAYVDLDPAMRRLSEAPEALERNLELLLAEIRNAAREEIETGSYRPREVRRLLAMGDTVRGAANLLRRGNPNHTLLLESMLLRLTSIDA